MKKAKWMLSIIVIVAVMATSMAFRVNLLSSHFIFTGQKGHGVCTILKNGCGITGDTSGQANVAASTESLGSNCPDNYTISGAD